MKIVLLDTGRGVNPDTIRMWRENLQLTDDDTVALMAWQPPREPLPVTEHYVFGPRLDLRTSEPRHVQTKDDIIGGHDIDATSLADDDAAITEGDPDDAEIGGDDSPMSETDLAGQLPEAVSDTGDHSAHWESTEYGDDRAPADGSSDRSSDPDGARGSGDSDGSDDSRRSASNGSARPEVGPAGLSASAGSAVAATQGAPEPAISATGTTGSSRARTNAAHLKVAHLPRTSPTRLKHAVTWRLKKAAKSGKGTARTVKRSLKVGNNPVAKAAQQAIATRNGSIATQFAIALARSSEAAALFREADLVFPVDARSQRGAWLLARANAGPDVMVGYPAAIRALDRRRANR